MFEEWKTGLVFVIRRQRGYRTREKAVKKKGYPAVFGIRRGRIYKRKGALVAWEKAYYHTIYVENWKGSRQWTVQEFWTFTTSAGVATRHRINEETYSRIIESVGRIAEWVRDQLGLRNSADPTTIGSARDKQRKLSDLEEAPNWVRWRIEDTAVATFLVGSGQEELFNVRDILAEIEARVVLDYRNHSVTARVAR